MHLKSGDGANIASNVKRFYEGGYLKKVTTPL